jgi:hypothetical protein
VAAAQSKGVHTEHRQPSDLRVRKAAQQPQQGVPAGRHTQPPGNSGAGTTGQGHRHRGHRLSQQRRAPRPRHRQHRGLLGERSCRAYRVVAKEPPDLQPQLHRPARDRGIDQPPLIAAMRSHRGLPAPRTHGPAATQASLQHHPGTGVGNGAMTTDPRCGNSTSRSHSDDLAGRRLQDEADTLKP